MYQGNFSASPAESWIQSLIWASITVLGLVPQNQNNIQLCWVGFALKKTTWRMEKTELCRFKTGRESHIKELQIWGLIWGSWILKQNRARGDLQTRTNRHFQTEWKPVRLGITTDAFMYQTREEENLSTRKKTLARHKEMRNSETLCHPRPLQTSITDNSVFIEFTIKFQRVGEITRKNDPLRPNPELM